MGTDRTVNQSHSHYTIFSRSIFDMSYRRCPVLFRRFLATLPSISKSRLHPNHKTFRRYYLHSQNTDIGHVQYYLHDIAVSITYVSRFKIRLSVKKAANTSLFAQQAWTLWPFGLKITYVPLSLLALECPAGHVHSIQGVHSFPIESPSHCSRVLTTTISFSYS